MVKIKLSIIMFLTYRLKNIFIYLLIKYIIYIYQILSNVHPPILEVSNKVKIHKRGFV